MLVTEQRTPGFCIQLVVEGEGELSVDALEAAVATAAAVSPGARLVLRGWLGWLRWVPQGPVPPVRVLKEWPTDGSPLELERPLPPRHGPTCEVVLAPGPRLVFRCLHAAMDATGLLTFAADVFRALRGEPPLGADCPLNDTDLVVSLAGPRTRPPMKSGYPAINGGAARDRSETIWRRLCVPAPCPGLAARITTSLARQAARFHASTTRVMIPVDLRNYRKDLRATGNLTSVLYMDIPADRGWRELHKEIIKRLAAKEPILLYPGERAFPWLPLWLVRWVYGRWLDGNRRSGRFPFSAMVTHVALSGYELGGGGFQPRSVWFLPVSVDLDFLPLAVSAVTGPREVEIVVSAPRGLIDERQLEALCEGLMADLSGDAGLGARESG